MITRIRFAMIVIVAFSGSLSAQELKPTPALALESLKKGNDRFVADNPNKRDLGAAKRSAKQKPYALILTCADSRVVPELLFDTGLGELFVVRVAGNVVGKAEVGSIEYAVEHLKVKLIVVLGHESCGAVDAALSGEKLPGDLGWLVKKVKAGANYTEQQMKLPMDKAKYTEEDKKVQIAKDKKWMEGVRINVRAAAADLEKHKKEAIQKEVEKKAIQKEIEWEHVTIVGAVYWLTTGKVEGLDAPEKKKASTSKKTSGEPQSTAEPIPAPAKVAKAEAIPAPATVANAAAMPTTIVGPARFPRLRALFGRGR
jgi:carbonic anhydrase